MDIAFLNRNVNEGFSGGEKKRNEILQLSVLEADLAILVRCRAPLPPRNLAAQPTRPAGRQPSRHMRQHACKGAHSSSAVSRDGELLGGALTPKPPSRLAHSEAGLVVHPSLESSLVFGVFVERRCRELGRYAADGQGAGGLAAAAAAAVQDEIDSGLDVDALRDVATAVNGLRSDNNAVLMITHYQRLLDYIQPDFIHIMEAGKIVRTGGPELAAQLEEGGFASLAK